MNATIKKNDDFSVIKLGKIAAALETECADLIARMRADVEASATAKAAAKEGREGAKEVESTLWADFVTLARTVDAFTIEAANEKLTAACFDALVQEIAEGEAAKSIAAYASTAKKAIGLVRTGAKSWPMVEEASYGDIREALKSDDAKLVGNAKEAVNKVIGRIAKHKNKKRAAEMLREVSELIETYAVEADASREDAKHAAKMAKELTGLKQQAPTEPATLETVKVEAQAA